MSGSVSDHVANDDGALMRRPTPAHRDVQPYRNAPEARQAFGVRQQATGSENLSRHECLRLLVSARAGRIVYSQQAMPAIEPVDFTVDGDSVVIRADEESRLAKALQRAVVAFEADEYDAATGTGWSVTIVGESSNVDDPAQVERLSGLVRRCWALNGKDHFIRISVASVVGRRIHPCAAGLANSAVRD